MSNVIKAHTSIIGDTGYNCHSRNFFKELHKIIPVQVRNFTIGSSWDGYNNDEPHNGEYYIDDHLKTMLVQQTLDSPSGRKEFPLYQNYKNEGDPNIHIVLNETDHYYFYDDYDGIKIAYNVWETTRQPDNFFERLKTFDQVWVPSEWQRQCTIEQGIPADKVKVVPEGVDTQMYKPINRVVSKPIDRPFRFLLVGRWDYRKATREIIESFVNTFSEDENVEMILSVDNLFAKDGLNSTEERLKKFGIFHKGLKVVHHLSKEEYSNLIKTSDVFVSCARGEGWNLPLIEAMSSGVPSMYSNWGAQLEFAIGKGIPINVIREIPAVPPKDDNTWISNASGNFAEPDFKDLSKKMRDVYKNYTVHKRKALEDSDLIRERFTWENSAKIASDILLNISSSKTDNDDSVAIILSHANNDKRKSLLNRCLSSIEIEKILSSNYPVDSSVQNQIDWLVYSKENPILHKDEYDEYGVSFNSWWVDSDGKKKTRPFIYEHSYAVYELTRQGLEKAKSLGKKYVHIINYDYIINSSVIRDNIEYLKSYDLILYRYDNWETDNFYCSAFISGKVDTLLEYFTKYESKESYYKSMPGFNVLEANMYRHFSDERISKKVFSWKDLKKESELNLEDANNFYYFIEHQELIGKSFKEISDYFDCDKSTYHRYDRIYPVFLEKWRDYKINIFEIGIDEAKSINTWRYYFPKSLIWGMDISKKYTGNGYKVFIGDQSKIEDLINVSSQIPKCNLIVDDGSHVAEHQIKSFNYLFENLLEFGGVYIIEDTECSYWHPLQDVYGYETGNLNIVDYFTNLNHLVNDHYNDLINDLHIKSITFAPNCIIIQKKEIDEIEKREYRFKDKLRSPMTNVKKQDNDEISINFIDGAFVEIKSQKESEYNVDFIDIDKDNGVYSSKMFSNRWSRVNRKWFTNWKIRIQKSNGQTYEHDFDASNKRVFIVFESSSLGDTIAWIPYVDEFRKKHNCHVIVSTFHNHLFESTYSELEFVKPGSSVDNLYALYRVGVFYDENGVDFTKHKKDFKQLRLQEYAADILGLDYEEIRPRIKHIEPMSSDKPYICIANHSTAQSKYWNNPTGWQELVDYVKSLGYDVYLLSREEDGYMGNKNPKGVIKVDGKSLEEIGSILLGSQGFIGLSSGLSWLSWALNVPTILISGVTETKLEPTSNVHRIINEDVCHGCFARHLFDKGDWNWCPDHKGTDRQFECSKSITFQMVKSKIDKMLSL